VGVAVDHDLQGHHELEVDRIQVEGVVDHILGDVVDHGPEEHHILVEMDHNPGEHHILPGVVVGEEVHSEASVVSGA